MRRAAVFMAVLAAVGVGCGPVCPSTCAGAAAPADVATMGRWETRAPALSDRSEVAGAAVGDRIYVVGGLTAIGVTAGLCGALALGRLVASLLYGLNAWDPATLALAAGLLGAVALGASWIPARRAANVDPMRALRHE